MSTIKYLNRKPIIEQNYKACSLNILNNFPSGRLRIVNPRVPVYGFLKYLRKQYVVQMF